MLDPVSGGIYREGEVLDLVSVDAIVQAEENPKACLRKNCVRGLGLDVIVRDLSARLREPRLDIKYSLTEKCEN